MNSPKPILTICTLDGFMRQLQAAMRRATGRDAAGGEPLPKPEISQNMASIRFSDMAFVYLYFRPETQEITRIVVLSCGDGSQKSGYEALFALVVSIAASGQFGDVKNAFVLIRALGIMNPKNIRDGYRRFYTPVLAKYGLKLEITRAVGISLEIADKRFL